ncbi:MAG: 3-hydroxyacyl-CoA dehydrogenase NAD-binding domain-containing protein [Pikeienuella sp.]
MSAPAVSVTYEGDVAIVTVTNPPVNALSQAVRQGIHEAVAEVDASDAGAAVLICDGRTFIAGADIREFDKPPMDPDLNTMINAIEGATKTWVAAIHGTALGGGLEAALGCHIRVAAPTAKMGLPEVHLGILPGAGGTQRLPRVVGAAEAVSMITSGAPIGAAKAAEIGLVDEVAEDFRAAAIAQAKAAIGSVPNMLPRTPAKNDPSELEWGMMRMAVEKKAKGQMSPVTALQSVRNAFRKELPEGLKAERELFTGLKESDQSRALRYAFFAERAVAKPTVIAGIKAGEVKSVAVVGGGLMGSGIATSLLNAGLSVVMVEMNEEASAAGRARVEGNLASAVKRGKQTEAAAAALMARLTNAANYSATADCDLAIEAVFEDLEVKRSVFASLEAAMRPDAILATNTSYIDPNQIFANVSGKHRVVGAHFFSPAHIMRLCEVVQAAETSAETLATVFGLAKRMKKIAALSGVCDGFIGNRMLAAYRRVCDYMMEDMRDIEAIDAAMRGFGLPMGPFELIDLAGLQIGWAARKRQAPNRDPSIRYSTVADTLCEASRFGQKTGAGWYKYEEGNRKPISDPFVADVIAKAADGRLQRSFTAEEIQRRAMAAMVNEGAKIIEEGIAARPLDVDMVKLFGYGFPRWRGGPMMHADIVGVDQVLADMEQVAADDPGSWAISDLLRSAAVDGGFQKLNG